MKAYYLSEDNKHYLVVSNDTGKIYTKFPIDNPEQNSIVLDISLGKYDKK